MATELSTKTILQAFEALDRLLNTKVTLIVGGGTAIMMAHGHALATHDVDAIPKGVDLLELDRLIKAVAKELGIAPDWLNSHYSTFTHTLPDDYSTRLIEIYRGQHLNCQALGALDLLVLKCFAHRQKDVSHAKVLIKRGADLKVVEAHLESLKKRRIPGTGQAIDFLDDVLDQMESSPTGTDRDR